MVSPFQSKNRNKFWAKSSVLPKWVDKAHLRRPQKCDRNTQQITSTLFSQFHRHVSGSAGAKFQFREYSFIVSLAGVRLLFQIITLWASPLCRKTGICSVFFSGTTSSLPHPRFIPPTSLLKSMLRGLFWLRMNEMRSKWDCSVYFYSFMICKLSVFL